MSILEYVDIAKESQSRPRQWASRTIGHAGSECSRTNQAQSATTKLTKDAVIRRNDRDIGQAYAGKQLGSREFVATGAALNDFCGGLAIDPSWYVEHSPYATPIAPSMIVNAVDGGFPGDGYGNNLGTLWIRQQWDLMGAVIPGVKYTATGQVVDMYEHRNRIVKNQEVSVWSPDGVHVARGRHHQSYSLDQTSGKVELRDPNTKESNRSFPTPNGEHLEAIDRIITPEMCNTFYGGNTNFHTDQAAARALGFEDVIVSGRITMSYIGVIMERRFGAGWYEGGRMDIKFTNVLFLNERVIARGVVTDTIEENGLGRAHVAVWVEKEDGTVVIVGTASALEQHLAPGDRQ